MAYNDERRLYGKSTPADEEDNYSPNRVDDAYPFTHKKHRYPYSIVWTPLPLITSILPMIGHTGIGT